MDRSAAQSASNQLVTAIQSFEPLKDFQATIDSHPGTQQATVAQLLLGEQLLRTGSDLLYTNKPEGTSNLGKAADAFVAVEASAKDPMLRAWALYGLGRAHESLGELDRARKDYEQLMKDYPQSSLADDAEQHLKNLEKQSTKEFYDWFAKQDPRPLAMEREPGKPGQKPVFDLSDPTSIPSSGEVKLPSSLDGSTTPGTPPAEPMPTTEPAPSTEKAPATTPAEPGS
jgi:tetratricopeptide (TPR) repeat protein